MLILLFILLIVLGAGKLPEIKRGLGQAIEDFRRASQDLNLEETWEATKDEQKT